jgi:hypothetical protein
MASYGIHGAVDRFDSLPDPANLDLGTIFLVREDDGAPNGNGLYWVVKSSGGRAWTFLDAIAASLEDVQAAVAAVPKATPYIVGPGPHDPYPSVEAARDAAVADGIDAWIHAKPGLYEIAGGLSLSDRFLLTGSGAGTLFRLADGSDTHAFHLDSVTGVTLRDFAIDGNPAEQADGSADAIRLANASNIRVEGISILGSAGHGIHLSGNCTLCLVTGNTATHVFDTAILEAAEAGNQNNQIGLNLVTD